jgi:UDP-2,3-diacylglucosamine pyrophosphatase LpxH
MMVLVSDLHLTDGSTARNVNPEAFALMASLIRDTAAKRGAREIHLVLLGDIFDLVRTDYWHRTGVPAELRPWGGQPDPRTAVNVESAAVERQFADVLAGIVKSETAQSLGAALASLGEAGVPLLVTYVVGNHDRVLWNFPGLRAWITGAYPAIGAFVSTLESPEYGVVARHGHEWDEQCHGWLFRQSALLPSERIGRFDPAAYQVMAIGEVVTAELMGGLVHFAREGGGSTSLVDQVMEVNNLRPIIDVFSWLEWMGEGRTDAHQRILFEALRSAVDGLLETRLAKQWDRLRPDLLVSADIVDRLQQARGILLGANFKSFKGRVEAARRLQGVFTRVFGEGDDRLLEGAASEEAFKPDQASRGIQRVVYGHTHRATHRYFSGSPDGKVQMYVNTGTYLPLISRAADQRSFASSMQMSLIYLYREDEDTGGKKPGTSSMDIWTGIRRKIYA